MRRLLAVIVILGAQVCSAGMVTYAGNAFTTTAQGAGSLNATFDFSAPLSNGATLTATDIASFSITAAGRTITSSDAYTFSDFAFVIGAGLLPVAWHFLISKIVQPPRD